VLARLRANAAGTVLAAQANVRVYESLVWMAQETLPERWEFVSEVVEAKLRADSMGLWRVRATAFHGSPSTTSSSTRRVLVFSSSDCHWAILRRPPSIFRAPLQQDSGRRQLHKL
jgi:hypothetical protein